MDAVTSSSFIFLVLDKKNNIIWRTILFFPFPLFSFMNYFLAGGNIIFTGENGKQPFLTNEKRTFHILNKSILINEKIHLKNPKKKKNKKRIIIFLNPIY